MAGVPSWWVFPHPPESSKFWTSKEWRRYWQNNGGRTSCIQAPQSMRRETDLGCERVVEGAGGYYCDVCAQIVTRNQGGGV